MHRLLPPWSTFSLKARLLTTIGLTLLVIGIAAPLLHVHRLAGQYRQDMGQKAGAKLDSLLLALQADVIAGNDAAIEQALRAWIKQGDVDYAEWRGNHAQPHRAEMHEAPIAPAWFNAYAGLASSSAARRLTIGPRDYGELALGISSVRRTNQLWDRFTQEILSIAIELALIFSVIAIVLKTSLGSLSSLVRAARRFREGHYAERGQLTPGMAPELRDIVEAVNQAADHLEQIVHAVQGADEAISICGMDGKARFVNHAFTQLTGLTLDDIQTAGNTAAALGHPTLTDTAVPLAMQGQTWRGQFELDIAGKGMRTVRLKAGPVLNEQQIVIGVMLILTDITEQERSSRLNERLGRILDDSLNEIYVFDAETLRFTQVNRGACANLGYTLAEMQALTPVDIKPYFTREIFQYIIAPLRTRKTGQMRFNTVHRRKDGSEYPVDVRLQYSDDVSPAVFYAIIEDITARQAAEQALMQSHDALREYSAHLQQAREEEKFRIAREIHDDLGGTLTALKMDAFWLSSKLSSGQEALQHKAQAMQASIDHAVRATRRIVSELRPTILDDLGLVAAMQWQAREFELRTGIACTLFFPPEEPEVDSAHAIVLFRILQEALTNIAKHAGAQEVEVHYENTREALTLIIQDDGCGIPGSALRNPARHGIRGMMERAQYLHGEVQVAPGPGKGTVVSARLPRKPPNATTSAIMQIAHSGLNHD